MFNEPIGSWNVDKVTSSKWHENKRCSGWMPIAPVHVFSDHLHSLSHPPSAVRSMFYEATSFDQDLSRWEVVRVKSMQSMCKCGVLPYSIVQKRYWKFASDLPPNRSSLSRRPFCLGTSAAKKQHEQTVYKATSFSHNLCSWGYRIRSLESYQLMFEGADSCPYSSTDPVMGFPPGPFCHACNA